ncbi:MAG: nucleolar RNA-binding Nop10p family protein [Nitrososphaerales archaeon]
MNRLLRKCKECGTYTLHQNCQKCGSTNTVNPHPAKFSMDDKYLRYRMPERYAETDSR